MHSLFTAVVQYSKQKKMMSIPNPAAFLRMAQNERNADKKMWFLAFFKTFVA